MEHPLSWDLWQERGEGWWETSLMIRPQCNYRTTPLTVIDQWGTPLMKTRTQGAPRSQTGKRKRWEWKSQRAEALKGPWSLRQQVWGFFCFVFYIELQVHAHIFPARTVDCFFILLPRLRTNRTLTQEYSFLTKQFFFVQFQTWGLVLFHTTIPFTNILCTGECHWADWNLVAAHGKNCSNDALKAEKWSIGEESCICLCLIALAKEFQLNPPWWL